GGGIWGGCWWIFPRGGAVAFSWKGPRFWWPGLRSNRSMVLGPPFIHSRMHDRLRAGSFAAAFASGANHPDTLTPTLRAPTRRKYRRSSEGMECTPVSHDENKRGRPQRGTKDTKRE